MKKYRVYRSKLLNEKLQNMPKDFIEWLSKIEDQLVLNPYVGKPLGFEWFREKKYGKYRLYYLIYEDLIAVYLVTTSEKKDQQKVINTIKLFLDEYREEIDSISEGR